MKHNNLSINDYHCEKIVFKYLDEVAEGLLVRQDNDFFICSDLKGLNSKPPKEKYNYNYGWFIGTLCYNDDERTFFIKPTEKIKLDFEFIRE